LPAVRELRPGVWYWQSPHPAWDGEEGWPELVSSYAIELGDDVLLFDPLAVPEELHSRATAVVLTAPYHERDARRLGLPVHTPPADTWQDWVEKFGVDPERVRGMESEDLAWLRAGESEGHFHAPGPWPFGITAYAGREDNDLIFWLPSIKALVTGDSLSDFGDGLGIQLGGRKNVTHDRHPTASAAAWPAHRARAARPRLPDQSHGARNRAFLSGARRLCCSRCSAGNSHGRVRG
jgi:hypothetical protein